MRGRSLLLVLVAVLAAGLGWLGWRRLQWERVEEPAGYQGEARRNPYLAAQRLLQRTGHPVTRGRGLPHPLPPPGDELILPERGPLAADTVARLADWVARGGLLLAAGLEPEDPAAPATADPLFRAFGVEPLEFTQALQLVLQRRRVSQDLLKSQFGSSARATNILSLLEVKEFIHKPEGSNRWDIHFDKIESYLRTHYPQIPLPG